MFLCVCFYVVFFVFLWLFLSLCVSPVFCLLVRCLSLLSFFCSLSLELFVFAWNAVLRSLGPIVVLADSAGCKLTLMLALWSAKVGMEEGLKSLCRPLCLLRVPAAG